MRAHLPASWIPTPEVLGRLVRIGSAIGDGRSRGLSGSLLVIRPV
ncbi:hypothetical protein [Streptomyces cirratus]|nr:hypothetical protein [Streptomyces cirratus]